MGYNWYEEDLASFILNYELPAYNRDYEIKKFFSLHAKQFLSDFDAMISKKKYRSHSAEFYSKLFDTKTDIKKTFDDISKILIAYDKSDFKDAQETFDNMMERTWDKLFITSINGLERYNPNLYRIRAVKRNENLLKPSDLFHIPYSKRSCITNERYSLAGHPCLYLSTFLGIAWEECGYPSQFYYSEFKYIYESDLAHDWNFITLISSRTFSQTFLVAMNPKNENNLLQWTIRYLTTYPLILACSIVNLSGSSVFKPEYIIPQMLLQWVRRNYGKIQGITYFSCVATDDSWRFNGYNVVIPAVTINRKGFGKNLVEKFQVSKPIYCNNLLSVEDEKTISDFKDDLRHKFDIFPDAAMDCISMMYEITQSFNLLISKVEETNMKLVVSFVKSIGRNCSFFRNRFIKSEIVAASEEEAYHDNQKVRIENFCTCYDRFITMVVAIIEKYDTTLSKIAIPQETAFHKV